MKLNYHSPMKFKFYSDPGHGWVAVKKKFLIELGVFKSISPYSYMKGNTVYLEEDRDAALFLSVLKDSGVAVQLVEKHTYFPSKIRYYEPFSAA